MRSAICLSFVAVLASAPSLAHADPLGCLLGPSDLNRCTVEGMPATVLGAIAAPVLIAGAAVSIADELRHRTEERDAAAPATTAKHGQPASLALVPDPPDPYRARAGGKKEARNKPNPAFQFNETATNVTTVVAGAMVVGAVIATIVHDAHK